MKIRLLYHLLIHHWWYKKKKIFGFIQRGPAKTDSILIPVLHSDRFLAKGEINRRVKRRPKFTSGPRSVMAPVWNQTDFPWRFYYFLIACLRGRMNGSVLYETCMGFRLGMMTLYKIYIYILLFMDPKIIRTY